MKRNVRKNYLDRIIELNGTPDIKIITGIRRSGKSKLISRYKIQNDIFNAFTLLISRKQYSKITIQEIIEEANVGRSTFYAHFETKEELLQSFCEELFDHILDSAVDNSQIKGRYSNGEAPESIFCHILQHLENNDHNILTLFTSESSEIFLKYFKNCLKKLIREQMINIENEKISELPEEMDQYY